MQTETEAENKKSNNAEWNENILEQKQKPPP